MRHRLYGLVPLAALALMAACGAPAGVDTQEGICPQTHEFGNYGCARLVAVVTTAAGAPAGIYLRAVPVDTVLAGEPAGYVSSFTDGSGMISMQLTWYTNPPKSNALPYRLFAMHPETAGPRAVDSTQVLLNFAPVGQRPAPQDTLRWRLPE
ncbi:MAG: hypothetical protein U0163_04345 [Gemmatimonadaceae bacterium]